MQPNQKRRNRLSPLVIRSLGVLAITLMAMTTSLASSTGVPTCEQVCDQIARTDCDPLCRGFDGTKCIPFNTSPWCFENCQYVWQCTERECVPPEGPPGERLECVLNGQLLPAF